MNAPVIIPDVHGCKALLDQVLAAYPDRPFAFLGDLIDRGPDSPGVLDVIYQLDDENRLLGVCKGNHEDMAFAGFLDRDRDALLTWVQNGGAETMVQYLDDAEVKIRDDLEYLRRTMVPWMPLDTPMGRLLLAHGSRPDAELLAGGPEAESIWARTHLWEFQGEQGADAEALPDGYLASVHGHRIQAQAGYDTERCAIYLDAGPAAYGKLAVLDTQTGQIVVFTQEDVLTPEATV